MIKIPHLHSLTSYGRIFHCNPWYPLFWNYWSHHIYTGVPGVFAQKTFIFFKYYFLEILLSHIRSGQKKKKKLNSWCQNAKRENPTQQLGKVRSIWKFISSGDVAFGKCILSTPDNWSCGMSLRAADSLPECLEMSAHVFWLSLSFQCLGSQADNWSITETKTTSLKRQYPIDMSLISQSSGKVPRSRPPVNC